MSQDWNLYSAPEVDDYLEGKGDVMVGVKWHKAAPKVDKADSSEVAKLQKDLEMIYGLLLDGCTEAARNIARSALSPEAANAVFNAWQASYEPPF